MKREEYIQLDGEKSIEVEGKTYNISREKYLDLLSFESDLITRIVSEPDLDVSVEIENFKKSLI